MPGIIRIATRRSDPLGRLPLTKRGNGDVAFRIAGSPTLTQREAQMARVIEDAYSHLPPQAIIDLFENRNFGKFSEETLAALAPFGSAIEKILLDQFNDAGEASGAEIASQISDDYRAVGKAEVVTPSAASLLFKFDRTSPTALAWAKSQSGAMITNMTSSNIQVFRSLVTQAYEAGLTPQGLKSQIFTALQTVNPSATAGSFGSAMGVSMNGLTARYEQAVMNRANRLIFSSMKSGMSAEKAVAKATKDAKRYADRLRRARARTIARTELLKANNEGRLESFVQAQKKGLIGKDARKVWATSRFDVCNICAPLNGQMAPLKSPFPNGVMTPPAHPNCRCSITLLSNVKTHNPPTSLGTGKPGDPLTTTFGGPTELGQTLAETPLPDVPIGTSMLVTPKTPATTIQAPPPPPAPVAPPPVEPVAPPPVAPAPATTTSPQTIKFSSIHGEEELVPVPHSPNEYMVKLSGKGQDWKVNIATGDWYKLENGGWSYYGQVPQGSYLGEITEKLTQALGIPEPVPVPASAVVAPPKPKPAPSKTTTGPKLPTAPKKVSAKGEIVNHTIYPDGTVFVKNYKNGGVDYGWLKQTDGNWIKVRRYESGAFSPITNNSPQFLSHQSKMKFEQLSKLEEMLASKGFQSGTFVGGSGIVTTPVPTASFVTPTPTASVVTPAPTGGAQALTPITVPEPQFVPANTLDGFEKVGTSRAVLVEDHAAASRLGGQNPKRVFTDPTTGQQYIFKPQPRWQALLEEASADTTSRLGITGPQVATVEIDGQVGSLHKVMSAGGKVDEVKPAFKGAFDATKLSKEQAEALQVNQILDHLLSNHDAHADQFIRLASSEDSLLRAIGIDKGQAFKHLGKARETESLFNGFPGHTLFNPNNNAVGKQPYIQLWESFFSGKDVSVVAPSQSTEIQTVLKRVQQLLDKPNDPFWQTWTQVSKEMAAAGKSSSPTAVVDALRKRFENIATQIGKMEKEILATAPGRAKFLSHLPDPEAQRNVQAILAEIDPHLPVKGSYEFKTRAWWDNEATRTLGTLNRAEKSSIISYTGSSYSTINRSLEDVVRNGRTIDALDAQLQKVIRNMDSGMAKGVLSENVKISRGTGSVKIQGGQIIASAEKAQGLVGKILEQEGFVSTSITPRPAFVNNIQMEISAPAGTRGHFVAGISRHKSENEFLIDRHYRFLVTGVRKEGGRTIIEATVIPDALGSTTVPITPKPL